jgi:hypothetical protein
MPSITGFQVNRGNRSAPYLFRSGVSFVEIRGSGIAGTSTVRITTSDNSKEWTGGFAVGDPDPSHQGFYTLGEYEVTQTKGAGPAPEGADSAVGGGDGTPQGVTVTITVTNTNDNSQGTLNNQQSTAD